MQELFEHYTEELKITGSGENAVKTQWKIVG